MPGRLALVPICVALVLTGCRPAEPKADETCALTFSDTGTVRVFAVGHAFQPDDALDYDSFERSYLEDMAHITPCLSKDRPNLVTFPEDSGLIAWFVGRRAMLARGAGDSTTAFNAVYAGHYRQADAYLGKFPGISSSRALTLALGDPAWRAMDQTFGRIAKRHGVWVVTSANVPPARLSMNAEEVAMFGDPDVPASEGAYVADKPEVYNMALLYDPTGARVGRVDKVFLTDPEIDALDLNSGRLDGPVAFELPFGTVGAAISRDAFYAPFVQRMEDVGAELVVQPEAFSGWMVEQEPGDWLPHVITASGWTHTQKYRGLRHSVAPMLAGNLYEMLFDGQTWITEKAVPSAAPRGFVGTEPTRGWIDIGPWVMDDPVDRPLEERRKILFERGRALAPGSGGEEENQYRSSLIGADLSLYGPTNRPAEIAVTESTPTFELAPASQGHQFNVSAAADSTTHQYAVWTDTRDGAPRVFFSHSQDGGATWSSARPLSTAVGVKQLKPAIAATASGRVAVVWQEESDAGPAQLRVSISDDFGESFLPTRPLEAMPFAQWEPAVAFDPAGAKLAITWADFREAKAPKLRMAFSSDWGHTFAASQRVDASAPDTARYEGTQLQPALAWGPTGPIVAWIDYRERDWQVWAAAWQGDGFGAAQRVSPDGESEVLASDPQLVATPQGVALAWDELRERRSFHDVRFARFTSEGRWAVLDWVSADMAASHGAPRYRPSLAATSAGVSAVCQDLSAGKNALVRATLTDAGAALQGRVDGTGDAPNQLTRPRVLSQGDRLFVFFEDDRAGWSRIRVLPL